MKLNENKDHIATLLRDTIVSFCKNFVSFKFVLKIEGFIVLTCDEENVLVVKIDDSHKGNYGISNSGSSHDTSFGPGTTSKLFALSNPNKPVKARQPLSLQYSNWNTGIVQPQVLKQPKATKQKAPQPLKKIASFPRGMAVGQRMGAARPRPNGQRPAVPAGARRMGGVRQRMPSFPRNVAPSTNSYQNMALLPMTNFGQRLPSMNMSRQSLPVQSRQLAVQCAPRRMDASDASESNLAICNVASNEVVETTSPIRYLDESREKMFRDVVSDALSKLDGNKSTELSPPGKVSGSIPVTSDCIMALVPVSQTISTATHNVAQNFYPQNEFSVNPGKQTIQSFPCLPLNSNANQAVHNAAQCSEKARSSSHLQISLITKSNSNLSIQPSSMQPVIRPNPNSLNVPSQQWPRLISGSIGYLTKQSDPAVIWPTQMIRTTSASVHGPLSSVPQSGYGMIGQANSGVVQWPSSNSQLIPRLQQASYLSNDLKNQLHNVFDKQVQPVQQIHNVYPQQIQPRYTSPVKNNSVGILGSSVPFQSLPSQSLQSKMHFQNQMANPYFTSTENHAGMVYYQPNANLYQFSNHQDISARGLTSQERNFYNQTLTEKISQAPNNYPGNTLVGYSIQVPVLQNPLNQLPLNVANVQRSPAGQQFIAANLHIERPAKTNPQQQVIQFKAAPSAINVIRSQDVQVVPRSLTTVSGALIPPSPIDSLSSLSSSSSQKLKSTSEYLIPQEPSLCRASATKPIQQTISQILQSPTNVNPIALQLAFGVTTSTKSLPLCSTELMRSTNQAADGKVVQKRLPPLRLKNLGHGNLMVIASNGNDSCENGTLHIPGKEDDLEAIAMSQVMMAVEGLKEYSSRKNSNENTSPGSCKVSKEQDINRQNATLMSSDDINNQSFKISPSENKVDVGSLSLNLNNESTSQIIKDVHLGSVDEFFTQNILNDDLIPGNLSLDHEPILETFGVFDVCRNEVVVTRNGNIHDSSSNERLSTESDQTMDNSIDVLKIRHGRHKNVESDSSDTTEIPDLNSRVESCCDVNFDNNSQGQYTCQACQISMDSDTMLAEHYSTFHNNPEIHWREHEVRPYMDRIEQGYSSDSQSTILSCPHEGCSRSFIGSRQVISHYSKAHKLKMSYKEIMLLKSKEGSLIRCSYCRLKFPTKRLLQEHVSRMH